MNRILSLLAVLTVSAAARADDVPFAFLSTNANESYRKDSVKPLPPLRLRPNSEGTFYAYVCNPGEKARKDLKIALTDSEGKVLAEASLPVLNSGKIERVKLVQKLAAPAPAAPATPEKPAVIVNATLPERLLLKLTEPAGVVGNPDVVHANEAIDVRYYSANDYLTVKAMPTVNAEANTCDLTITLADNQAIKPFGPPCEVSLNIRSDMLEGLDKTAARLGTYKTTVAADATGVTLIAKDLKFLKDASRKGIFTLNVDGVNHALVYRVDFSAGVQPFAKPGLLRIDAPEYAGTDKPVTIRLEVLGDEEGYTGRPRLDLFRNTGGTADKMLAKFDSLRDRSAGFKIGTDGQLVVASSVNDWLVKPAPAGQYGPRTLKFTVENGSVAFAAAERTITFDDTPPINIQFIKPPESAMKGKKFKVIARAEDPESGLRADSVTFYLGKPPADGKSPPAGTFEVGVPVVNSEGSFEAMLDVPADAKGKFEVTAKFSNKAGMVAVKSFELDALDAPTTGTIEGRVIQGDDRAQSGLNVELKDAEGKVIDTVKSNEKGDFKFANLKPGQYSVSSIKPIDYNAKGEEKVKVIAGESAKPIIKLKR